MWFWKSTPSSWPSIWICPTFLFLYFCLPPPAPVLAPNQQARRLSGQGGTNIGAAGDTGAKHSFPYSSPCLPDAWWNEGEAAQPWPHIPDECPLSKAWAVPKWCVIYLTGKFHSLLSQSICAPLTLDRKSNAASIWYWWQTAWQSLPRWLLPMHSTIRNSCYCCRHHRLLI